MRFSAGQQAYPLPGACEGQGRRGGLAGCRNQGSRIKSVAGKGWDARLRLYGPLSALFTQRWRAPDRIQSNQREDTIVEITFSWNLFAATSEI
jgi:hypothetical protein